MKYKVSIQIQFVKKFAFIEFHVQIYNILLLFPHKLIAGYMVT
jgi:hypothetical protein